MAKHISLEEKMKGVNFAKNEAEFITQILGMQIKSFRDSGFKPPFDAEAEEERAEMIFQQYEDVLKSKVTSLREKREKKIMICGFEDIFNKLYVEINRDTQIMHESWTKQYLERENQGK